MRINVTGRGPTDGEIVTPIDPPPPLDINEFFELRSLGASATDVVPFANVDVAWSIAAREGVAFQDFVFDLVTYGEDPVTDIGPNGQVRLAPYRSTLVRVVGRRRGSGDRSTLGEGLVIAVDESQCETVEISSAYVNAQVIDRLTRLTSDTAELRLRRRTVPRRPPATGFHEVELEVEPTWELGVVRYFFPLEVVINNFFNADLDVTIWIRFSVHHQGDDTDVEVRIEHSSEVDFDTVENILSLGHAGTAAKTANRLIPLVLACEARVLERDILREVLGFLGPRLDTHRLLAIRVVPLENFSYLAIVLCPLPDEPDWPGPVVVDPTVVR